MDPRAETETNRSPNRGAWGLAAALSCGVVSVVAWMLTIASAPRYSNEDMGDLTTFLAIVFACALVGGYVFPIEALAIAAALGLPALVLSPWTAPRGDNDGLWILVVPYVGMVQVALFLVAAGAALARLRIRRW